MTETTKDIIKSHTVRIHDADYLTVAGRVQLWHKDQKENMALETHTRIEGNYVVAEAIVKTTKGTFTGTSAVSLSNGKTIEKESPFEVAETSAVGRALGFANYGVTDSIASADEMHKATRAQATNQLVGAAAKYHTAKEREMAEAVEEAEAKIEAEGKTCTMHDEPMERKYSEAKGKYYFAHWSGEGKPCFGDGYRG